ncbi:hypothetical protein GHT06_010486 [Daphnia sinensis]|uniref:Methyltransferase domain-containing protein n=1 Tax=Daphnia sinensis TaxID=1820382 RepID=A0AAD5KYA9_9CRUS|nr:hypothetical protein GHT06_010486 [Daphnia sinensis]
MALETIKSRKSVLVSFVLLILVAAIFHVQHVGIWGVDETVEKTRCPTSVFDWRTVSVDAMSAEDVMNYFMWTNRTSCRLANDFGGHMKSKRNKPSGLDGQKAVCLDPVQVAPPSGECVVYSFGINDEWSFDDIMELYGCQVYAFDPSMKKEDYDRSPGIHFLKLGLHSRDWTNEKGWQLLSLSSIYNMLKKRHGEHVIDYLKMDIESSEWEVIPQIIKSGMLDKIRQLAIEIHLPTKDSLEQMRDRVRILRSLEEEGMVRFDSKMNPWSTGTFKPVGLRGLRPLCYEIAWYNSKFLNGESS